MIEATDLIKIGILGGPHGTKGAISLLFHDNVSFENLPAFLVLEIDSLFVPFRLLSWEEKKNTIQVQLKGVNSPEEANKYTHFNAYLFRSDVDTEELIFTELEGFTIIDQTGKIRGKVKVVDESTQNVILETEDGNLFPFHEDLLLDFNEENKTITLQIADGL